MAEQGQQADHRKPRVVAGGDTVSAAYWWVRTVNEADRVRWDSVSTWREAIDRALATRYCPPGKVIR